MMGLLLGLEKLRLLGSQNLTVLTLNKEALFKESLSEAIGSTREVAMM